MSVLGKSLLDCTCVKLVEMNKKYHLVGWSKMWDLDILNGIQEHIIKELSWSLILRNWSDTIVGCSILVYAIIWFGSTQVHLQLPNSKIHSTHKALTVSNLKCVVLLKAKASSDARLSISLLSKSGKCSVKIHSLYTIIFRTLWSYF